MAPKQTQAWLAPVGVLACQRWFACGGASKHANTNPPCSGWQGGGLVHVGRVLVGHGLGVVTSSLKVTAKNKNGPQRPVNAQNLMEAVSVEHQAFMRVTSESRPTLTGWPFSFVVTCMLFVCRLTFTRHLLAIVSVKRRCNLASDRL
jgi:hypothetical protein